MLLASGAVADVDVAAIDAVAAGAKSDLSLSIEAVNLIVEAAVLLMNCCCC